MEVETNVGADDEEVVAVSLAYPKQSPVSAKHPLQKQEEGSLGEGDGEASPRVTGVPAYHQLESEIPLPNISTSPHARSRAQQHRQHTDYEPVQRTSPSDVYGFHCSSTEGSSFGSNCSANELLPQEESQRSDSKAEGDEDDEDIA